MTHPIRCLLAGLLLTVGSPAGVFFAAGPADPAEAPGTRMTLAEAVARAREVSPRLARFRSLQTAAEARWRGARAERLPVLDLTAGYTRNSDVPEYAIPEPGGGSRVIFPNLPDTYRSRLSLTLPLLTGGRIGGTISATAAESAAASDDLKSGAADLTMETTSVYWTLVVGLEDERVLRGALASYEAHRKETSDRFEVGAAARNDVLAVQVERDRAELMRLEASSGAALAQAGLLRLLDLPPGTRILPAENLEAPPPPAEDFEMLVAEAIGSRPERRALAARTRALEARAGAARAGRRPQARLDAGYDYASPNRKIFPLSDDFERTWDVGIGFAWSIADGGRTAAAVAGAEAEAEAARRALQDLEDGIRLEVRSRLLDLQTAAAAAEVADRALESAGENQRVAGDRYGAGLIPSSELLDAETNLLRAGLERTRAFAAIRLALARLDRSLGR